jgi:hypothetical protein
MNTQSSSEGPPSDSPNALGITGNLKPSVPVFACIVYVCKNEDGTISGRVANLAGEITATGGSERDALMKLTREFRSRVLKLHEENQAIPLLDPPPPPLENEQMRTVPVHL